MARVLGGLIRYAPWAYQLAGPPRGMLRAAGIVRTPYIEDIRAGFGKYALRGKTLRDGAPAPFVRVWLFSRKTPLAARLTRSDAQGNYVFKPLRPEDRDGGYVVVGLDDTGVFDPSAHDLLQPVEEP